jgi:hypothetical protein
LPAKGAQQILSSFMVFRKSLQTVAHDLEILEETHSSLIYRQGAQRPFAEPGKRWRQAFHHVAESLEGDTGSMNGDRVSWIDRPMACDSHGKGLGGTAHYRGQKSGRPAPIRRLAVEVCSQSADRFIQFASFKAS